VTAGPQFSSVLKEIDRAAHDIRNIVKSGQTLPAA
jgi:hypothetical protein